MPSELISVIVPVYGAEAYLDKCIKSVREQDYKNLEIILVDDGSKDRGGDMCDEYAHEDDRIKVIHKENGGLMSAWMEGVKKSTGQYLCFVDSDDYVDTRMISDMHRYIQGGREIICCNYLIEHTNGAQVPMYHGADPGEYSADRLDRLIKQKILGNENRIISMSRCMKLISRELIENNMKYCDQRIRMAEDVNIMLPALMDAERIYVMRDACYYHYYYNDESIVHHYDKGLGNNMKYVYTALKRILDDKHCGQNYDTMLEKEMLYMFMLQLKNEMRNTASNAAGRMLNLITEENIKKRVKENPLLVKDKGNRLLYLLMKHPGHITAAIVLVAFRLKNR